MMMTAGKHMNANKWHLCNSPGQQNDGCGLNTILFSLCLAKRLPSKIIIREWIAADRYLLLLHPIDVEPDRVFPLPNDPVGLKHFKIASFPFHWDGQGVTFLGPILNIADTTGMDEVGSSPIEESKVSVFDLNTPFSGSEDNKPMFDLTARPTQMDVPQVDPAPGHALGFDTHTEGTLNESSKPVLDLITPKKNSRPEINKSVFNPVTPPKKKVSCIFQRLMLPLMVTQASILGLGLLKIMVMATLPVLRMPVVLGATMGMMVVLMLIYDKRTTQIKNWLKILRQWCWGQQWG
jgi:hypothetical protein